MTQGIAIDTATWKCKRTGCDRSKSLRVHFWDFGGQEIQHQTHKIFLTKQSLYLVVVDNRQSEAQANLDYWLRSVESYGGDAPVLLVINQCDHETRLEFDETALFRDYACNLRRPILRVSCRTGEGRAELLAAIMQQIAEMPHVHEANIPESYFQVKDALAELAGKRDLLDYESEYVPLCKERGLEPIDQATLIRVLHNLGTVLHFDDPEGPFHALHDASILDPEWVTRGIYAIVTGLNDRDRGGVLRPKELDELLADVPGDYSHKRRGFLLDLLQKFELAFPFPDDHEHRLLLPGQLSKSEPAGVPEPGREVVRLEYHYPRVLPPSVMSRFIVRMHRNLTNPPTYWRNGVVLEIEGCRAVVRAHPADRIITIAVGGLGATQRRMILQVIRQAFHYIHGSFPALNPKQYVPVPPPWQGQPVAYDDLVKMELAHQKDCWPSGGIGLVPIRDLLEGVEDPRVRADRDHRAAERGANSYFLGYSSAAERRATYDVFLSHNSRDKPAVRELRRLLMERRYTTFLDEEDLVEGQPWQEQLVEAIQASRSVAVLVGPGPISGWVIPEMRLAINQAVTLNRPAIPMLLPGAPENPELPPLLAQYHWLDLRSGFDKPKGLDRLERAIRSAPPLGPGR